MSCVGSRVASIVPGTSWLVRPTISAHPPHNKEIPQSCSSRTPAIVLEAPDLLFFMGSLSGSMLQLDTTPLGPGGQQPYNGAFGEAVAGPSFLVNVAMSQGDVFTRTSRNDWVMFSLRSVLGTCFKFQVECKVMFSLVSYNVLGDVFTQICSWNLL